MSGAPGTADVTASIMSEQRGDGIFNPKPIPDLGGDPAKLKVKGDARRAARLHPRPDLEEFDGPEPQPAALDSIVAYVRALGPSACEGGTSADHVRGQARRGRFRRSALPQALCRRRPGNGPRICSRRRARRSARSTSDSSSPGWRRRESAAARGRCGTVPASGRRAGLARGNRGSATGRKRKRVAARGRKRSRCSIRPSWHASRSR